MDSLSQVAEPVVAFVGVEPSDALYDYAVKKIEPISRAPAVQGCRIVLEAHNHSHAGHRYRAKIEIQVPRTMLVVGTTGEAFADIYAAIDDATLDAMRVIHERARREHQQRPRVGGDRR